MSKFVSKKFFGVKNFSFFIGFFIFLILFFIFNFTGIINKLDLKILDLNFSLKNTAFTKIVQEGTTEVEKNSNISDDILIVGIDSRSLGQLGKWPFPRYRHADFLSALDRIKDQNRREKAVFLDIFFIEPDMEKPYCDALLAESIRENNRVYLETILDETAATGSLREDYTARQEELINRSGEIKNVTGDWHNITTYYGTQPPLLPFAKEVKGYGHANFKEDSDKIYRRQGLISKLSLPVKIIKLDDLTTDYQVDEANFQRMGWSDIKGIDHYFSVPANAKAMEQLKELIRNNAPPAVAENESGEKTEYYTVTQYQDKFIPAITLSLALEYFNKTLSDIEIRIGEYIRIPQPQLWNSQTATWENYTDEILIPIDSKGQMLINFAGGNQTFPVRSYSAYAGSSTSENPAKWPSTKALDNKILMVGAYSHGMAEDEKTTPYGLMYGVEIHANALNTILTGTFLHAAPMWINMLILAAAIFLTVVLTSRFSTILAFITSCAGIILFFLIQNHLFEKKFYMLSFPAVAMGIILTFLLVVVYRVMIGEKDKKMIKNMFGKYVCPAFVDQMISSGNSPELGGTDRDLTVLFSDIRGFTTLSETMTPQQLVSHLNEYLTVMTDTILSFYGTLDKYVGDEIMCFWGAPIPQENHALLACQCALRQMEELHKLNEKWPPEKRINIGIGVNSGIMTVGNMGSEGRMNYTLMGDNVNLGARLEGTNKEYGTNIIISEFTYEKIKDYVIVRELDNIRVKGKKKPVLIYELLDIKDDYNKTP